MKDTKVQNTVAVLFFDKPTIGFCKDCNCAATYRDGLQCPVCGTDKLSIFVWDEESEYPE